MLHMHLRTTVAALLSHLDDSHLKMRVHGLGMLQVYLPADERLHIWHRSLRTPKVSRLHTHAWRFSSHVVCGVITNTRYLELPLNTRTIVPDHSIEVYHKAVIKPGPKPQPEQQGDVRLKRLKVEKISSGVSYHQEASEIHETEAEDGTVTLVSRARVGEDSACIYWQGGEFVSAEPRKPTNDEIGVVVNSARSLLGL